MSLSKKPLEKSPTPTWDFKLDAIEKDFDALIKKHHDKNGASNTVVLTQLDKLPEDGFYLMLLTRKKDKLALRQFGSNITSDLLMKSFISIINSFNVDKNDPSIGRG